MPRSLLAAALLLVACGDKAPTDSAPPADDSGGGETEPVVTWLPAFDTSGAGSLSGVWGSGPDDVWIVGGDDDAGEIWHFDGGGWSEATLPDGAGLVVWVYGFGPNDIYAVGVDGTGLRYDGSTWSTWETGTDEDLWGVWGSSPSDMWVVGGNADDDNPPVILHWDGSAFTPHSLAEENNPRRADTLFKVWGIEDKTWIVGQAGTLLELQGEEWVSVSAGANANQDFVSLWGTSASQVVIAGGRGNARIGTYDGTTWDTLAPSGVGGLNAVAVLPDETAIMGGIGGFAGRFDHTTGELVREEFLGTQDMHAAWYDGAGTTYMVGGTFIEPHQGSAWIRTVEDAR